MLLLQAAKDNFFQVYQDSCHSLDLAQQFVLPAGRGTSSALAGEVSSAPDSPATCFSSIQVSRHSLELAPQFVLPAEQGVEMQCDGDCKNYVPEELFISSDYELLLLSNYVALPYNFFFFNIQELLNQALGFTFPL